jgi:uncharacterized protein YydD (DUF2326 family)
VELLPHRRARAASIKFTLTVPARALMLGARATRDNGLQYIVAMNSDIFDRLPLAAELEREKIVVATRLSDETETGGLFGFRFD